jgi:N utilization substance protein B
MQSQFLTRRALLKQQANTPASRHKARRFALQGLYEWQLSGNDPFEIEARYRVENAMHKVDLAYFHELLHQTTRVRWS